MIEVIHCGGETAIPLTFAARLAERIAILQHCEEPEDVSPSANAVTCCSIMLGAAARSLESYLPLSFPMISVTEKGGILCEWRGKNWSLYALFAPDGVLALHDLRLRGSCIVSGTTTPRACAADLEMAWRKRTDVDG